MHIPNGATHTDIRFVGWMFNVGTSFIVRYGPVIVTNAAGHC